MRSLGSLGLILVLVGGGALGSACAGAHEGVDGAGAAPWGRGAHEGHGALVEGERVTAGQRRSGAASSEVSGAVGTRMPTPARARGAVAVAVNQGCEGCHEGEARAWRASLHHRANTEPAYQRAFALEPLPFCRGCHAPEGVPTEEAPEAVGKLGVGCVTCHVTGDAPGMLARGARLAELPVLAAPWRGASAPPAAPHGVVRDARFGGAEACAGCHEFAFPTAPGRRLSELMQSTISEHRASASAGQSCAGCHMPEGPDGRRRHAFVGSRDEGFVRSAVQVSARRVSATGVEVTLSPANSGHAFPTGDLFRRLSVSAEALGPDEMVLGGAERFLARHFELRAGQSGRRLVSDDRVHGTPVVVALDVGDAGVGREIGWQVTYQRVAHPNGVEARAASVEGEVRVASGRLAP
ncbi:uncharacterized protein CMC5_051560 [Chondromyces crocatus]|uniref:Cytochrome c-552/4 domain-containing protein n=2 Tax=Chondromyces crocatus TaxID=52 RepID=A0A0K1EJG1_CHOCO|nr:uncharacterized protein CMC5_051560 [Chondromyces crocatus]